MALGASGTRIQYGVLGHTLRLAAIGIALGGVASFAVARAIASLLYDTGPYDPAIFAATVAVLGAVALVAGQLPARRGGPH